MLFCGRLDGELVGGKLWFKECLENNLLRWKWFAFQSYQINFKFPFFECLNFEMGNFCLLCSILFSIFSTNFLSISLLQSAWNYFIYTNILYNTLSYCIFIWKIKYFYCLFVCKEWFGRKWRKINVGKNEGWIMGMDQHFWIKKIILLFLNIIFIKAFRNHKTLKL